MTASTCAPLSGLDPQQRHRLAEALRSRREAAGVPRGEFDLAVLGGGVAGLTLALQLSRSRPGTRVLLVEKQEHPVPETTHKVGESTVEIAAHYLRDVLGMADHLETRQIRKFGLRMFFTHGENKDIAERVEVGTSVFPPLCTYQLDRGRLENELVDRCREAGVRVVAGARVLDVTMSSPTTPHAVEFATDDGTDRVTATWLVDASGRSQHLRRTLGLPRPDNEHAANAAWLRIAHPVDVNSWTGDPAWAARITDGDRSLSTNHLMGPGYWVWIIRLASGSTSVGIVADAAAHPFTEFNTLDRALQWLREREPQLADTLVERRSEIQDFRVMRDYSYGCQQVYDGERRWCLTGEAGLFLDPLYSPGLDLIAISNNLVTDLVTRGLAGEDVGARAVVHDKLFRSVAEIWMAVYRGQYPLMGNARVMSSKVIWDTAFYWGVFGTLFFNDKFRDLSDSPTVAADLGRLTLVSNRVQAFFREWASIDGEELAPRFVDLYAPLDFMGTLHAGMADELSPPEFSARFSENTRLLSQLAGQLVSSVIDHYAGAAFDDHVVQVIQNWQRDPLLAELVAVHRRDRATRPTSDGWITLTDSSPRAAGPQTDDLRSNGWDRHGTAPARVGTA
jgi:flavin-dependent dehydrogenase